ncbi:MAG: hypothetical protein JAY90_20885 [Candidatus Thiodiazotropha lotti]|nr:hypothetical protein [Candidatus Thiodiazotropha lotti]
MDQRGTQISSLIKNRENSKEKGVRAVCKYPTFIVSLIAFVVFGGCSTSLQVVKQEFAHSDKCWNPNAVEISEIDTSVVPAKERTRKFAVSKDGFFNPEYLSAIKDGKTTFEPFLDCFLAPHAPASTPGQEPTQQASSLPITKPVTDSAKLYRGYLALALFANYGAYNIEVGEYDSQVNDAAGLLARIVEAQNMLLSADKVMAKRLKNPVTDDQRTLLEQRLQITPNVERLRRTLQVIEVYIQAERPTIERLRSHLTNLSSLGTFFSPTALEQLGDMALVGLKKSANLSHYGRAYVMDIRKKLEDINIGSENLNKIECDHWEQANALVVQACDRLAVVAEVSSHQCGVVPREGEKCEN